MTEELTIGDFIMTALVVVILIAVSLWAHGYYKSTYDPPPDTLPPMEQP